LSETLSPTADLRHTTKHNRRPAKPVSQKAKRQSHIQHKDRAVSGASAVPAHVDSARRVAREDRQWQRRQRRQRQRRQQQQQQQPAGDGAQRMRRLPDSAAFFPSLPGRPIADGAPDAGVPEPDAVDAAARRTGSDS